MDLDGAAIAEGVGAPSSSPPERENFMDEEYYDWEIMSDGEEEEEDMTVMKFFIMKSIMKMMNVTNM